MCVYQVINSGRVKTNASDHRLSVTQLNKSTRRAKCRFKTASKYTKTNRTRQKQKFTFLMRMLSAPRYEEGPMA